MALLYCDATRMVAMSHDSDSDSIWEGGSSAFTTERRRTYRNQGKSQNPEAYCESFSRWIGLKMKLPYIGLLGALVVKEPCGDSPRSLPAIHHLKFEPFRLALDDTNSSDANVRTVNPSPSLERAPNGLVRFT